MRFFEPELSPAVLMPPQAMLEDKFGGLPWGLPAGRWPRCAQCGQPQSLLAQLRHHPDRLDLRREGRVLHVFQCADWWNSCCDPAEWGRGASACFVLEPEDLGAGLTPAPGPVGKAGDPWGYPGHIAARVVRWVEREESIPDEHRETYFSRERWFHAPEGAVWDALYSSTKLGGIPYWGNAGPFDHPPEPWRFVLQIEDRHWFPGAQAADLPQRVDESGRPMARSVWQADDGSGWDCRWANFGTGVGHVYLDGADPPAGRFTWQRF